MGLSALPVIDWSDLESGKTLPDKDVVRVSYEDIDPNTTEIALWLVPPLTWWKGVQTLTNTNKEDFLLECQGLDAKAAPRGISSIFIEYGGYLVLWKAKAFGVHTAMYRLDHLEHIQGKRATFKWIDD